MAHRTIKQTNKENKYRNTIKLVSFPKWFHILQIIAG